MKSSKKLGTKKLPAFIDRHKSRHSEIKVQDFDYGRYYMLYILNKAGFMVPVRHVCLRGSSKCRRKQLRWMRKALKE